MSKKTKQANNSGDMNALHKQGEEQFDRSLNSVFVLSVYFPVTGNC